MKYFIEKIKLTLAFEYIQYIGVRIIEAPGVV